MSGLIPSSFLPHLPRTQYTFAPLQPADLLAHISVLRELYLPPIHGGLRPSDTYYDSDEDAGPSKTYGNGTNGHAKSLARRMSESLADSMDGLGLAIGESSSSFGNNGVIEEEDENFSDDGSSDEEDSIAHLDPFEKEWAQKWLEGVFRRAQTWIEENPVEDTDDTADGLRIKDVEAVLRDATAVLAMMAGTSAAGSLTRHLLFPVNLALAPALHTTRSQIQSNPNLSPETQAFISNLSSSPISPILQRRLTFSNPPTNGRRRSSTLRSNNSNASTSPSKTLDPPMSPSKRSSRKRRGRAAIPVLLHDAPMGDHLSVGVQTWGSAILLGREMALRPEEFGLVGQGQQGVRVLELGAGTGLLSILCRKLLDLQAATRDKVGGLEGTDRWNKGLVVATDFLPSVLDNLKVCVDLNFPPSTSAQDDLSTKYPTSANEGVHIAKLDWTTFPAYVSARSESEARSAEASEEMERFLDQPFDLVLASDCVYDPTHAEMLRQVARWVLRLPNEQVDGDQGGTFHILSPLRPTFAPELESIDTHFPTLSTYPRLSLRGKDDGEGLGKDRGLRLGVRGEGKRSVRGRKGEGRVDETLGYWWWEVGWG